jgi:N-acetylneuraminic acid mutarotase
MTFVMFGFFQLNNSSQILCIFIPMKAILNLLCMGCAQLLFSQNVGINTPTPDPKAVLDVYSNERGALLPRLTTVQRDAILSPPEGLEIYNLTTHCTRWVSLCAPECAKPPAPAVASNSPVCAGSTLNLTATSVTGATYIWTGPAGFYSTTQNPTVPNMQLTNAGDYRVRVFVGGCYSDSVATTVAVTPSPWASKAQFPGNARNFATGFVIADSGYVGSGTGGTMPSNWCNTPFTKDFYKYDPLTDTWAAIAPLPASAPVRFGASGFAINGFGYVGGGLQQNCVANTYTDFYRYNPATGAWTQINNITGRAESFNQLCDANNCYWGLGRNNGCNVTDFLRYNHGTDTWTAMAAFPGTQQGWNAAFHINGMLYVGVGESWMGCVGNATYNSFYRYNPATNTWSTMTAFPGQAGQPLAYWAIGNYGYVIDRQNRVYRYDPAAGAGGTWSQLSLSCPFPGVQSSFAVVLVINGKAYIVNTVNQETWEFTP